MTEQGKLYNESIELKRQQQRQFDETGRRLFIPSINRESVAQIHSGLFGNGQERDSNEEHRNLDHNSKGHITTKSGNNSSSVSASTAAVDEYLYQDARDREERQRLRYQDHLAQTELAARAKKINSSSYALLKRKAVSCIISIKLCCNFK